MVFAWLGQATECLLCVRHQPLLHRDRYLPHLNLPHLNIPCYLNVVHPSTGSPPCTARRVSAIALSVRGCNAPDALNSGRLPVRATSLGCKREVDQASGNL